jgi:hypothetical protein
MVCKEHTRKMPVSDIGECPHCIISSLRSELSGTREERNTWRAKAAHYRKVSAESGKGAERNAHVSRLLATQVSDLQAENANLRRMVSATKYFLETVVDGGKKQGLPIPPEFIEAIEALRSLDAGKEE